MVGVKERLHSSPRAPGPNRFPRRRPSPWPQHLVTNPGSALGLPGRVRGRRQATRAWEPRPGTGEVTLCGAPLSPVDTAQEPGTFTPSVGSYWEPARRCTGPQRVAPGGQTRR